MRPPNRSRAAGVRREGDGVVVTLEDGREVEASHALLAVGSIPNTTDMGLEPSRKIEAMTAPNATTRPIRVA